MGFAQGWPVEGRRQSVSGPVCVPASVGRLRVLAVARVGPEAAVPGVDNLVGDGRVGTVPEGRERRWEGVRVGWTGAAAAAAVTVRKTPVVDESLVEDGLVVDVLGGVLRRVAVGGRQRRGVVVLEVSPPVQRARVGPGSTAGLLLLVMAVVIVAVRRSTSSEDGGHSGAGRQLRVDAVPPLDLALVVDRAVVIASYVIVQTIAIAHTAVVVVVVVVDAVQVGRMVGRVRRWQRHHGPLVVRHRRHAHLAGRIRRNVTLASTAAQRRSLLPRTEQTSARVVTNLTARRRGVVVPARRTARPFRTRARVPIVDRPPVVIPRRRRPRTRQQRVPLRPVPLQIPTTFVVDCGHGRRRRSSPRANIRRFVEGPLLLLLPVQAQLVLGKVVVGVDCSDASVDQTTGFGVTVTAGRGRVHARWRRSRMFQLFVHVVVRAVRVRARRGADKEGRRAGHRIAAWVVELLGVVQLLERERDDVERN